MLSKSKLAITLRAFFLFFLTLAVCLIGSTVLSPEQAEAQYRPKAVVEEAPTKRKRKYVHPCPAGTEQFGEVPPDGYRVYCRQRLLEGYRKHGNFTAYYQNNTKRAEGDYHLDRKHGTWKAYHRNGQVKYQEEYNNGKRTKKLKFNAAGQVIEEKDRRAERMQRREGEKWRYESWADRDKRRTGVSQKSTWKATGAKSRRKNVLKGRNRKVFH